MIIYTCDKCHAELKSEANPISNIEALITAGWGIRTNFKAIPNTQNILLCESCLKLFEQEAVPQAMIAYNDALKDWLKGSENADVLPRMYDPT